MSIKRDHDDIDEGHISDHASPKRVKTNKRPRNYNPSTDPTWGQKYVFSSSNVATTIPAGEESEFEDDADAMAYLSSVRTEAFGIPQTLVAPKIQIGPQLPRARDPDDEEDAEEGEIEDEQAQIDHSIYEDGVGDARGYYEDGAYVAAPSPGKDDSHAEDGQVSHDTGNEIVDQAFEEAYFSSLVDRFQHLRALLHTEPPSDAADSLPSTHPTYADPFTRNYSPVAMWTPIIQSQDPHPTQMALMSKDCVINVLRVIIAGRFLRSGYPIEERTSRWLWALLARLPDRGELTHTEIGWVRDLGRRAVLLGRSLAEMAALRDELEDGGLGVNEGVDEESADEDGLDDAEAEQVEESSSSEQKLDTGDPAEQSMGQTAPTAEEQPGAEAEKEDGEASDDDVAMDTSSETSLDGPAPDADSDLQDAKSRLLARLEADGESDAVNQQEEEMETARQRSRVNMRATLNMILTVAGEIYGQRDLLEFRELFVGM